MEYEYNSIFVESNESIGILYKSYQPVINTLNDFLFKLESLIRKFNNDPENVDVDLSSDITKFRNDINITPKPEPIEIGKINSLKSKIKLTRNDLETSLKKFAKLKNELSYGGSFFDSIIKRPKVYTKDIYSEKYTKINSSIRNINRAMDWIEKCFIDLFKLVSQDNDILNIVDRVYIKTHIFENCDDLAITNEDVAGSVIPMDPPATAEAVSDKAILNTNDKKNSTVPGYILNNHDMAKYGEDDTDNKKSDDNSPITLDDYKRPSAEDDKNEPAPYTADSNDSNPFVQTPQDSKNDAELKQAVNNYYYYTYNNSLNRSHRDDHSDRSKHYDNSVNKNANINQDDKTKEFHKVEESDDPCKLNLGFDDLFTEDVGDADKDKPKSDHPVKDALMDIDRATTKVQQDAKRGVQNVVNVGKAASKPINRTKQWIGNMISQWKDKNETKIKEDLADPNQRSALLKAIRGAITVGALAQAGLLFNFWIIGFAAIGKFIKDKNKLRLRDEMIGELKTEMQIIDEKINDASRNGDNKAKYQLMRFKNELNKKLLRVGGPDTFKKVL